MTNETLAYIIGYFNRGHISKKIVTKKISNNVLLAEIPAFFGQRKSPFEERGNNNFSPSVFFLISDNDKKYAGIVHDMKSDLHWYITKKNRKNGYLTEALKKTILPYLSKSREYQEITFIKYYCGKYYEGSKKIAKELGFEHKDTKNIKNEVHEIYRKTFKTI